MTEGTNYSAEIASLRDTFLSSEKEYLDELLSSPENLRKIEWFKSKPLDQVVKYSKRLMSSMEMGVHTWPDGRQMDIDEKLAHDLEKEICLALYSIEDAIKVKQKVKIFEVEDVMER